MVLVSYPERVIQRVSLVCPKSSCRGAVIAPAATDRQNAAVGQCAIYFESCRKRRCLARQVIIGTRVDDAQVAYARNGAAQAHQLVTVELVCSAEVVDDFGNGFSGLWVALVVRQLEVLDGGAVFVFAFGDAQIHAYVFIVYLFVCQALYDYSCAYLFLALFSMASTSFGIGIFNNLSVF